MINDSPPRSILRHPNTPGSAKFVRFNAFNHDISHFFDDNLDIPPPIPPLTNDDDASIFLSLPSTPEPDPFRVNATTYYTPHTTPLRLPPPPPPKHDINLISTLRTQLALQNELCTQYEIDLQARDETVDVLTKRVHAAETEGDKRRNVLKQWKNKVSELERMCRHLEHEVDTSRQEAFERSLMDEASGEALKTLHLQIAVLEREKMDSEKRERALRDQLGLLTDDGAGEPASFVATSNHAKDNRPAMDHDVRQQLKSTESELNLLKAELEAQWKYTEANSEKLQQLENERDALREERDALKAFQDRGNGTEELESEIHQLWTVKESLEKERDEVGLSRTLVIHPPLITFFIAQPTAQD